MNITINVEIKWNGKGWKDIKFSSSSIAIFNNTVKVRVEMDGISAQLISAALPASVDLYLELLKKMEFINPTQNGIPIELDFTNSNVIRLSCHRDTNTSITTFEWELSSLKINMTQIKIDYQYILAIPFINLVMHIGDITKNENTMKLSYHGNDYYFVEINDDPNVVGIQTTATEEDFQVFRVHMAFYFNSPAEILFRSKDLTNGHTQIEINTSKSGLQKETLCNPELIYMNLGTENNSFCNFINNSKWYDLDKDITKVLTQAVYTYVRSKFSDNTMQFLTIYSVLDRFTGNKRGEHYNTMKKSLVSKYNVNIESISKTSDKEILKLKLKLERENGAVDVTNFCMLRDYILHFMTNSKIDDFLKTSEIVDAMRFVAAVIILKAFGFDNCSFKEDWKHLSVLIDDNSRG